MWRALNQGVWALDVGVPLARGADVASATILPGDIAWRVFTIVFPSTTDTAGNVVLGSGVRPAGDCLRCRRSAGAHAA